MHTVHRFVGVDVSKLSLDVFTESLGNRRFSNTLEGLAELMAWLGEGNITVGFEATSSYHVLASEHMAQAGCSVHVYNPRQVRDLAKGLGLLAKTDRIDARVIAQCVRLVESPFAVRSKLAKELRDVSRHIQYLTKMRADLRKKQGVPGLSEVVVDSLVRQIASLTEELSLLEARWRELAKMSPLHQERYDNLLTVPRIGTKSARVIVSELPEDLSRFSRKQLAAYFGLVPYDRQSGNSRGRSQLLHGNAHLRQPLFSVATLAAHLDPECRDFAQTLKAKGKHHLTVICAVMHKLARRAIAVAQRNTPWEENMLLST
jgi:transposase